MAGLKEKLRSGKLTLGTWVTIGHPDVPEILSTLPLDWVVFDMEHSPLDFSTLQPMMMGLRGSSVDPLIRVPISDPSYIKRALDLGSTGIVVPWINSAEEARSIVYYATYPPRGIRGAGPRRASMYGSIPFSDYYSSFEKESLVIVVQVETKEALERVDEIASVDGVDVLFAGPLDLSVSLGVPGEVTHPKVIEAMERVAKAARSAGKSAGAMALSVDMARRLVDMGFNFISYAADYVVLRNAYLEALKRIREG